MCLCMCCCCYICYEALHCLYLSVHCNCLIYCCLMSPAAKWDPTDIYGVKLSWLSPYGSHDLWFSAMSTSLRSDVHRLNILDRLRHCGKGGAQELVKLTPTHWKKENVLYYSSCCFSGSTKRTQMFMWKFVDMFNLTMLHNIYWRNTKPNLIRYH